MKTFNKKGAIRIQLIENNGYFIVRRRISNKWFISLETTDKIVAERKFYFLILLHTNQLKYINE